jgi:leukotriene-A4 hydrolase
MDHSIADRVNNKNDQSSLSNPSKAISTNIHLDWTLDFDEKLIKGTCKHSISVLVTGTETVDFDSSNLNIESINLNGIAAIFNIAEKDSQLGSKISVGIPKVIEFSLLATIRPFDISNA